MASDQPFTFATPDVMRHGPAGDRGDLSDALRSLANCIAGSAADFGKYHRDAWVYGIVLGWDREEDHQHDDICGGDAPMREMAARHGWDDAEVTRLRQYRRAFKLGEETRDALS
jgi:hypothetical protein